MGGYLGHSSLLAEDENYDVSCSLDAWLEKYFQTKPFYQHAWLRFHWMARRGNPKPLSLISLLAWQFFLWKSFITRKIEKNHLNHLIIFRFSIIFNILSAHFSPLGMIQPFRSVPCRPNQFEKAKPNKFSFPNRAH